MQDQVEIKCHDGEQKYPGMETISWRPTDTAPRDDGYQGSATRTCSYCGSINPEDLIAAIMAGAKMSGSDWKYGWPHKFYVDEIPNPIVGELVSFCSGGTYPSEAEARKQGEVYTVGRPDKKVTAEESRPGQWTFRVWEPAPAKTRGKFYSIHLTDLNDEDFAEIVPVIKQHTDIEFLRHPDMKDRVKGFGYRAPRHGHQR